MRKLTVFNFITLNGFYKGLNNDISWHQHGNEDEGEFAEQNLKSENTLLFGRVTYDLMIKYWPTAQAMKDAPEMAKGMNKAEKIVFSKSMKKADWNNTKIVSGNIIEEIKKLKNQTGNALTILGSGSIVSQFAEENLIDEYMLLIDPIAIGEGIPIFHKMKRKLDLKLKNTKKFKSGAVLHVYTRINN
jgi:dihydrofolate reductase